MESIPHTPSCWVISDGRRGIENQALGLAEAMARLHALDIHKKTFENTGLFRALPARVQYAFRSNLEHYGLTKPLPDIALGCGRQAIAPLLALRRAGVFTIYVQDPRLDPNLFNIVVAPKHDNISGDNVITMIGSPNRVTDNVLRSEAAKFENSLTSFPRPRVCVLIGGHSKTHQLEKATLAKHLDFLEGLVIAGNSLVITTSRRTPEFAVKAYRAFADHHCRVWLWDGAGDNPYFAFLANADAVLVSEDSTNMLTEACATGKPVYRLAMEGTPGKFSKLYDDLHTVYGVTRFTGSIETGARNPLHETDRVAQIIWAAMQKRG